MPFTYIMTNDTFRCGDVWVIGYIFGKVIIQIYEVVLGMSYKRAKEDKKRS